MLAPYRAFHGCGCSFRKDKTQASRRKYQCLGYFGFAGDDGFFSSSIVEGQTNRMNRPVEKYGLDGREIFPEELPT